MTQQPFFRRRRPARGLPIFPTPALAHAHGLYVGNRPDLEPAEIDEILSVFTGPLP